ncbi:MAG: hypothetical protein HUJ98_15090, partial [Bacteroidaceae bacterium]|nr:hypothetical protein [Bacteroidaceae bacterium]
MVRFLRNILILTIQIVVIVNLTLIVALNIPKVQSTIGEYTSELLSDLLHTEVSVGRVDIMLNQLVITDVEVKDQQRQPLLSIKKLAGKVD